MSCPYGNIKPDRVTHQRIVKCDFCKDASASDASASDASASDDEEEPNCVKNCPKKAIHVEEVVAEGVAV